MLTKQFNLKEKFVSEWFQFNGNLFFVLICVLSFVMLFLKRSFLLEEIAAFEILEERGEMGVINLIFAMEYLVVPFYYAWKITITTFVLWIGCFMFGYKLTFQQLWKLVLMLEVFFIIPDFIKLLWFVLIDSDPTYWDIKAFYPLSLINFFDHELLAKKWHYPLKAFNVFEITYWFLLTYGIYFLSGKKLKISYAIVFGSYVLIFLLWLGFYVLSYR